MGRFCSIVGLWDRVVGSGSFDFGFHSPAEICEQ
jgi:hypothetical protein